MKTYCLTTAAIILMSSASFANTSLENTYLELDEINVESKRSKKIINNAKTSIKKIKQDLISLSFEENIHSLKNYGIKIDNFSFKIEPLRSLDMSFIEKQNQLMNQLENTIDLMKVDVSQSAIIKIDRSSLEPYFNLKKKISQYTLDMGFFIDSGFENYTKMLDFAKETTNIVKVINGDEITYEVSDKNQKFCKDYLQRLVETEFIYENNRSFITEPLLGWDKLNSTLETLYKDCNEDA